MLCKLCGINECSELSHIIPAFVIRWLKEISLTGHLRGSKKPNLRMLDGPKAHFLCNACEGKFSIWEDRFAREIFYPIHRTGRYDLWLAYDDWLAKFCVSLSWRTLAYGTLHTEAGLPYGHDPLIAPTLQIWREFLLGQRDDIAFHRQHLLILGGPLTLPGKIDPAELEFYIERGIDYNSMHSRTDAYILTKLCRILIAGTIFTKRPADWKRTHVHIGGGEYSPGDFQVPGCIFTFFQTAVNETVESRTKISDRQAEKISDAVFKRFGIRGKVKSPD